MQSPSSSSTKHLKKPAASTESGIDNGTVANGVYRNKTLAFSCKIPEGWVLRTEEMNARDEKEKEDKGSKDSTAPQTAASSAGAKVLLAAFSRPPEARAEDVNASILIAAESVASYPGLEEAAQYFEPLSEVAKAQGFTLDENPYDIAIGTKTLVRGDFHKDVGSRVIGGTDDEVEDLVDGLNFAPAAK
jgi:hypothetical protein